MGDQATQTGAPVEVPQQDASDAAPPISQHSGPGYLTGELSPASAVPYAIYPEQPTSSRHAFASQLDMAYQQQRNAPFDMSAMANALPPGPYRAQPYSPGHQMLPASFGTPTTMSPMAAPQYYIPQQAHPGQFYTTAVPPQPPSALPPVPDLGYYQSPVIMSQQLHTGPQYYYPPPTHYPGNSHYIQGQPPPVQYGLTFHQPPDMRFRQPQPGGGHETNPSSPVSQINGQCRCPILLEDYDTKIPQGQPRATRTSSEGHRGSHGRAVSVTPGWRVPWE